MYFFYINWYLFIKYLIIMRFILKHSQEVKPQKKNIVNNTENKEVMDKKNKWRVQTFKKQMSYFQ